MSLFGTSGIRGTVGDGITADLALSVGRGIGTCKADRLVVGHDPRETSEWLVDVLAAGARECGADVVDLGLAATPTVARAVEWEDADLGVVVTASHNPPSDNGFKLWTSSGRAVEPSGSRALINSIKANLYELESWDETGDRTPANVTHRHVRTVVEETDEVDGLDVVVDVGHGAGQATVHALESLGADVRTLNHEPHGTFPDRPSEPTADACETLCRRVAETDADLGIAHDGDADRTMAVTESGAFVPGDVLLALFAEDAVSPGDTVAAPMNTSLAVDDHLDPMGVSVTRTEIGDVYVAKAATDPDVVFGGDPSGAWIWPDSAMCPDGVLAACRLAALVDRRGSFDALVDTVETHPIRRESVETGSKHDLMDRVRMNVTEEYPDRCSTTDGVYVPFDDGWFLIRPSGTEPVVRLTAEAKTQERTAHLLERAKEHVRPVVSQ